MRYNQGNENPRSRTERKEPAPMKKLHLIMNPNAGTRQGRRLLPDFVSVFNRAGYLCSVYLTEKRGDAVEYTREQTGDADMIVACGGDGTLNEVITGLLQGGRKVPVGYIPCGSTNDFATGLGIPKQPLKAAEAIVEGGSCMLDVGLFGRDRYFSYTASFGAFTSVSWSTPQNVKNVIGHAAYILEGIRSLADIRPIHMKITADGQEYENDYLFAAICNSTSLGGVLKLADSQVHMNDGLFEALFIPFPPDLIVLNQILNALRTYHYDHPSLHFLRASSFTFEGDPEVKWTLDGEEAEGAGVIEIRNIHDAVRIRRATVRLPECR